MSARCATASAAARNQRLVSDHAPLPPEAARYPPGAPTSSKVADNFAGYGGLSKLFFSFAMLLGRLEFFTLLTLLLPGFWRR